MATSSIPATDPYNQKKTKQSRSTDSFLDPTVDTGVPSARNDIAVPYLIGRRLIETPNTIWNSTPVTTVTTVETKTEESLFPLISSKAETVPAGTTVTATSTVMPNIFPPGAEISPTVTIESVETRFDFAFGLCLGPDVRCLTILDESKNILYRQPSDQETEAPDDPWVRDMWLRKEDIYMGMVKTGRFYSGSWEQGQDPTIRAIEGVNRTPGFRGTAYAVFGGALISQDDTIALAFALDIYRTPDPLELYGFNRNTEFDVNIATALYDMLTSEWGMLGVPAEFIDVQTFKHAGAILAGEANFCTVYMTQTSQAKSILGLLSDQAYGALRWNYVEKKLQFILFRDDYVIDDLPLFDGDNLEDITSLDKDHWITLPKAVQIEFPNRDKNYETMPAIVGLSRGSGEAGSRVAKMSFETISQPRVALAVGSREYARAASPLLSADLQANRDGSTVMPGDVVAVNWPEIYPGKVPFRVTKTKEKGSLLDTTTISVEQAILPIQGTAYGIPRDLAQISAEYVSAPTDIAAFAVPLFLARYNETKFVSPIASFEDNAVYPYILVKEGIPGFIANSNYGDKERVIPIGFLATTASLVSALPSTEGYSEGTIGSLIIKPGKAWDRFVNNPSEKQSWFMIGGELFRYDFGIGDENEVSLFNIQRGLVDTVAEDHDIDAEITFLGDMTNVSRYGYDVDGVVWFNVYGYNGKIISQFATPLIIEPVQRANLPACPQNAMVAETSGANSYPRPHGPQEVKNTWTTFFVSWLRRDYLSTTFAARDSDIAPADTTYDITITVGATTVSLGSDVTGNEHETTLPPGFPLGAGRIEITAKNSNGESAYKEFIIVNVTNNP